MEAGAAGTGLGEGGVNVHDEGVCPNGGAQVQVLKRRGGRVSVQPGVLAKDRRQGGKKMQKRAVQKRARVKFRR